MKPEAQLSEMILCGNDENCQHKTAVLIEKCSRHDAHNCSFAFHKDETNGCACCQGDEALFWIDGENNAFVDSGGEMLVTVQGKELRFSVICCPSCGMKFLRTDKDE